MSFFDVDDDLYTHVKRFKSVDDSNDEKFVSKVIKNTRDTKLLSPQFISTSSTHRILKVDQISKSVEAAELSNIQKSQDSKSMDIDNHTQQQENATEHNVSLNSSVSETDSRLNIRGTTIASPGLFILNSISPIVRNKSSAPTAIPAAKQPAENVWDHQLTHHHDLQAEDKIAGDLGRSSKVLQDLKADVSGLGEKVQDQIEKLATGMATLYRADAIYYCGNRQHKLEKRLKALALGLQPSST